MTELLHLVDANLREVEARVVAADETGVVLDRTVFYPQGGGQPGDAGVIERDGRDWAVGSTVYGRDRTQVLHVVDAAAGLPEAGTTVMARIDWPRRWARMRIHTALHLLTAVLPYPVTGGAIGDGEGRLDFASGDAVLDRADIEARLGELIGRDAEVRTRWITDDELLANPGLVKTLSVKPPMGSGRVRLVEIDDIDLQPCGGTHVSRTAEIGRVAVTGIESKGKQNRRVRVALA